MKNLIAIFLFMMPVWQGITQQSLAQQDVTVTYIANEGVFISAGADQILIDALHEPYRPAYLPTPPDIKSNIFNAAPPFNSVDILLVSHVHLDHFDAELVGRYLSYQQGPVLFSSAQVIDSVRAQAGDLTQVEERIKVVPYKTGESATYAKGGISVKAGKVTHGSARFAWVENLGHVVKMGGKTFLHVGDPGFGRSDIAQLLNGEHIDVALLPAWFVTEKDGRKTINEVIKPDRIIVVHVSPANTATVRKTTEKHYPEAIVFSEPMESVQIGH